MILLRRNDKIIIIVGVIILLIAGVGVALYSSPKVETNSTITTEPTTFPVNWEDRTGTLPSVSKFVNKGEPYSFTFMINQTNVKTLSFHMTWVDDKALLKRFGLDTLALSITTPDGKTASFSEKSQKKTKAGEFIVNVSGTDSQPSVSTITGNSTSDASARLRAALRKNDPWVGKEFNVIVTVTIGERLLKFRDKGNDFTLKMNYTYYDFTLGKTSGTGDDDLGDLPSTNTTWTPPYMSMILNTGCGRFV
jgi:hypothetical protein